MACLGYSLPHSRHLRLEKKGDGLSIGFVPSIKDRVATRRDSRRVEGQESGLIFSSGTLRLSRQHAFGWIWHLVLDACASSGCRDFNGPVPRSLLMKVGGKVGTLFRLVNRFLRPLCL